MRGSYTSRISFTRPADTTAYTAGDAIGTGSSAIFRSAVAPWAETAAVAIASVNLWVEVSSVPSGMSTFTLELYSSSPDAIVDNATWDLASAGDRSKHLGSISLTTPVDKGSTLLSQNDNINMVVPLAGPDIYWILRTDGAYTPSSAGVKTLAITTVTL